MKLYLVGFLSVLILLHQNCTGFNATGESELASMALTSASFSSDQTGRTAEIAELSVDSVGISMVGRYPACPSKPVSVQLWYRPNVNAQYEFQDECRLTRQESDAANAFMRGGCGFRKPIAAGTSPDLIMVRVFHMSDDCSLYGHEVAGVQSTAFRDMKPSAAVKAPLTYKSLTENRNLTIERATYKLVMEKNTGTTYELYSKRATQQGQAVQFNSVYAHQGGALQVAIHDNEESAKAYGTSSSYWNPTQAGTLCPYPRGAGECDPQYPTGGNASSVSVSGNQVSFTPSRLMSYSYDVNSPGPYNPADTVMFKQDVLADDQFIEYNVQFKDSGKARELVQFEIPTFYFSNPYRKVSMQVKGQSGVTEFAIPKLRQPTKMYGYNKYELKELSWISFENTGGYENDAYTIGWAYGDAVRVDLKRSEYGITTDDAFNNVKFTNIPQMRIRSNVEYRAKYIVFPYRHNELVTTRFGTMSVAATILAWKNEYEKTTTPTPTPSPSNSANQPPGFFLLKYGAGEKDYSIYSSNGTSYCALATWDAYMRAGGSPDPWGFSRRTGLPSGMRNDGNCLDIEPAGFFLYKYGSGEKDYGIYRSNGSNQYCVFYAWEKYLAAGGAVDPSNYPKRTTLPVSQTLTGECR